MRMRGEAASAASRVSVGAALGSPGACGTVPGAACGGAPGWAAGAGCCPCVCCCCLLLLRDLLLLLDLGDREQILPCDQDDAGQHEGEQQVLLVVHVNDPYRETRAVSPATMYAHDEMHFTNPAPAAAPAAAAPS